MPDETEPTPREVQSVTVDGQTVSYLTPQQQAQEDARQANQQGLTRRKPVSQFLRMFRITTQDRP